MIFWAFVFLVVSLVSGAMGLYEVSGVSMDIAQFLFWTFLIISALFFGLAIWGAKKVSKLFG